MKENRFNLGALGIILLTIIIILSALYIQEIYENKKINECPKVTIAYPTKFSGNSKIYYKFILNGKTFEHGYTMPFPTMGKFKRGRHLLTERFWLRVNCNDDDYNRIFWDAKVPDTLQYIPVDGWKEIPYGLDKKEE